MKKVIATIFMLTTLMILCVGCGKDVSGNYKLSSLGGTSVEDLQKTYDEMGININVSEMITIELKSDGTFTMKADTETESGTYEVDGEKISLTVDNETESGTIKGDTLTIGSGSEEMVFKK